MSKLKQLDSFIVEIDLETLQIDLSDVGDFFNRNWDLIKQNIEGHQIRIGATFSVNSAGIIGRIIDTVPLLNREEIGLCLPGSTLLKHFKVIGCGYISVYLYVETKNQMISESTQWDKMLPESVFLHREPAFVVWTISNICNLSCSHCYYHSDAIGEQPYTELADCLTIIDNIADAGVKCVSLSGGEPLLVPHLGEVIKYCKNKGLRVILNSNLVAMTNEMAALLSEIKLDLIVTSIESDRAHEHDLIRGIGAFESTVAGIRICVNAGLHVGANMAVTKINLNRVRQTLDYVSALGMGFLKYEALIPRGKAVENYDSLAPSWDEYVETAKEIDWLSINEYNKISIIISNLFERLANKRKNYCCPSGHLFYTITHKGDIAICPSLTRAYLEQQNLLRDRFATYINRNHEKKNNRLEPICNACNYGIVCEGGCYSRSYYSSGKVFSRDPVCIQLDDIHR